MNTDFSPVRLREIRTRNDLSMAEAGRLLNMSKMGYCRYEYGDRVPSYQTIQYIAELMGTSYDYKMPVANMLTEKIPITLTLAVMSFVIMILVSIPLGIYTAKHEKRAEGNDGPYAEVCGRTAESVKTDCQLC